MGPEHVLYKVLEFLPFTIFLVVIICIVSFLSYVTAADSNMDVISDLCLKPDQVNAEQVLARSGTIFVYRDDTIAH
mgnify:CR=1 FL=1